MVRYRRFPGRRGFRGGMPLEAPRGSPEGTVGSPRQTPGAVGAAAPLTTRPAQRPTPLTARSARTRPSCRVCPKWSSPNGGARPPRRVIRRWIYSAALCGLRVSRVSSRWSERCPRALTETATSARDADLSPLAQDYAWGLQLPSQSALAQTHVAQLRIPHGLALGLIFAAVTRGSR